MAHQFSQVPQAQIPRSSFNRSHGLKTTVESGLLVPIFVDEAVPGDTFNLRATLFGRLATPLKPFLDNVFCDTFFFAVPIRLIWSNWQRFNGEQTSPGDSTDYTIPQMLAPAVTGHEVGSLADYFGLPTDVPDYTHSCLWHRAYNKIFNDWFRDQNLIPSAFVADGDGPDAATSYKVERRGKRHDYFTSCLPWPQKGEPVTVPFAEQAPIVGLGPIGTPAVVDADPLEASTNYALNVPAAPGQAQWFDTATATTMFADLSQASGITINELRQSFQIQKLLERDARGGTRYTEIIRSHFGVVSPDARLQRPEFLGGGTTMVNINPVAQTSDQISGGPGAETPQGNLAAYGTVSAHGHGFTKSFTEHCLIIGLVNFRADLTYQQGINRMFSRLGRYDFYWPALSHIGEQAVLNKEIYAQGTTDDDDVFGYQERYAEMRYKPSQITGQLRSTYTESLDVWHLSQEFESLPTLSQTFIEDNPPIDRVIAVPSEPHFLLDCYFKLRCARPMPLYGVPGLIDHF